MVKGNRKDTNEVCQIWSSLSQLCCILQGNAPEKDSSQEQRTERRDDLGDVTPSGTIQITEPDFNLRRTGSERRTSESSEVSLERSKSSPSRPKPPVPKRPASLKKKNPGSVDAILETTQTGDTISPLRPVSLSLLRDTMASLPVDTQEFLFSDSEISSFNLSTGEMSNVKTSVNTENRAKEESQLQESSVTVPNHVGAVEFSKLEIRRDSRPYDNFPRNNQTPQITKNKSDNQSQNCDSQQSWVSFD